MILIANKNDDVDDTFYTHLELDTIVDFDYFLDPDPLCIFHQNLTSVGIFFDFSSFFL